MSQLNEDEMSAVRAWLSRNEFELISSIGPIKRSFGDRQETWARDGCLIRLTRDRGQWWYDMSREGAEFWLDVDTVAGAMGFKLNQPMERVSCVASIDDRVFLALGPSEGHAP